MYGYNDPHRPGPPPLRLSLQARILLLSGAGVLPLLVAMAALSESMGKIRASGASFSVAQGQLVIGSAVVFFVALLGIGVTANRLLVAPMGQLVATARRLAPGIADDDGEDEFAVLTAALQALALARSIEAAPFRAAITLAEEGVIVVQAGGRITYANAAAGRALSARQDQLIGAGLHATLHGPESGHTEASCPLLAPMRDGQARRGLVDEWLRGHQHRVPVSWSGIPLEDGTSPGRAVLVFEDRTRRNRIEEGLRRSARMEAVGQLAGGIAHDFNNLLTAILGYGDLLHHRLQSRQASGGSAENDAAVYEIEELLRAGHRAGALTRQLLTVSRPRQSSGDIADLNEMVRDMDRMLRRIVGTTIDMRLDLDAALDPVRADPTGIEQVVLNLVLNARDAMPDGGALTLRTAGSSAADGTARVWLTVADTGTGMSPEVVEQIFEPFFTTKREGTGIGLATVARIVQDTGGEIHVDSEPGTGTTFRVGWPALRPRALGRGAEGGPLSADAPPTTQP